MADIFRGNTSLSKIYRGQTEVSKVYRGQTEIWTSSGGGLPDPVLTDLAWWYDAGRTTSYPGTGTTINDLSGNGYNGTIVNSPTHTSGDSGYFTLNGTSQYISYTPAVNNFLPNQTDLTFELVLRCTDNTATNRAFLAQWGAGSSNQPFIIERTSGLQLILGTRENGEFDVFGSNVGTSGNWEHYFITMIYDSPVPGDFYTEAYVNNSSIGTNTWPDYTAWPLTFQPILWGAQGAGNYFQGDIAVMRLYHKALDASERLANYNLENSRYNF